MIDRVARVLREHGVTDSEAFLEEKASVYPVARLNTPHVELRGNVHMMRGDVLTRLEVDKIESELKFV